MQACRDDASAFIAEHLEHCLTAALSHTHTHICICISLSICPTSRPVETILMS